MNIHKELKPTLVEKIYIVVFHIFNPIYWMSGMMYLSTNTDRYRPIRPGDAFAMIVAIKFCIMYGLPIFNLGWLALWLSGMMHLSLWWLVGGNLVLFLSPPIYTILAAEYSLWQYNKKPRI